MTIKEALEILAACDEMQPHGQHFYTGDSCECDECGNFFQAKSIIDKIEE